MCVKITGSVAPKHNVREMDVGEGACMIPAALWEFRRGVIALKTKGKGGK